MSNFPEQKGSISFQLFDVDVRDDFDENGGGGRPSGPRKCKVLLSGRSMDGTSVFVCVKNFRPWFLVGLRDEEANIVDPDNYGYQIIQEIYDLNENNMAGKKYSVNYNPTYFFERRYYLYGWRGDEKTNGKTTKKFPWWTMCCPTIAGRRYGADKFKKSRSFSMVSEIFEERFDVWGDDIKPEIQFLIRLDLRANGWVTVPLKNVSSKIHTWASDCEIVCDIDEVKGNPDCNDIAPFRIVSWDGEMFSFLRDFPKPELLQNVVMNIGSSTTIFGNEDQMDNYIFNLYDVGGPIENVDSRCFEKEAHLLLSWRQWVMEQFDADILIGFNVRGFDWPFLVGRAKLLGIEHQFYRWSKLRIDVCTLKEDNTKSKQMGSRESFKWTRTFGLLDLDMLLYFHRNHKLRSYKLDDIAFKFLGDRKIDLTPAKMWSNFETPSGRRETAIYCVKDCVLPLQLAHKCQVLIQSVEMSRLTFTFLEDLQSKGQQIKIKHQLAYFCNRDGYVMNAPDENERKNMQPIKGATVVDPEVGYYVEPITTLDFTSLYPSIMQAWNLCWSSYIMKKHYQKQLNWTGAEYGRHFIPEKNETHIFVLHKQGLAPRILEELLSARRRAKKEMAAQDDPFKKSVLNGRQLALKISANSIYGYTAAVASNVYACSYIGETVTARGREMIEQTKNLSERDYPAELIYQDVPGGPPAHLKGRKSKVIYGDSVTGDTAVICKKASDGGDENEFTPASTTRIDEIITDDNAWKPYHDTKESVLTPDLVVWNDGGFTSVKRIIRHKCKKKMYRVLTHTGIVDCTSDHSLLRPDGEKVRPEDVKVGDELLHATDEALLSDLNAPKLSIITRNEAFGMGAFAADGSCGAYTYTDKRVNKPYVKYSWAINKKDTGFLMRAAESLPFPTKILDTIKSSGVYKLVPIGTTKDKVLRYRSLFYNEHREKCVPSEILCADLEVTKAFWDGFFEGDGCTIDKKHRALAVVQRGKQMMTGLWLIARRLGYKVSINDITQKPNAFCITLGRVLKRPLKAIKKIRELPPFDDYVYDFETESHHFGVGPGNLVISNTDSVMVKLPVTADQDGLDLSIKWGPIMAKDITKTFRPPINLEFEKVYKPFYLMKKKHYVGKKYELVRGVVAKPYIESKGTPDVRRDTFIVTSNLLKKIKMFLFDKEDPEGARKVVKEEMEDFMGGQVPFENFILSKSMKGMNEYKNPRGEVHLAVVKKMRQRNPGSEPRGGDRVNYVIIYSENRQLKQCEKSEDPIYAQEHNLKLDLTYYLEHKIETPIVNFYETFDPNIATYMASCKLRLEDEMSGALKFETSSDENVKRGAPPPMKKRKIKNTTTEKIIKPLDGLTTTQKEKGVSKTAPPPAKKTVNKNKKDESANKTFKTFGGFVAVAKK